MKQNIPESPCALPVDENLAESFVPQPHNWRLQRIRIAVPIFLNLAIVAHHFLHQSGVITVGRSDPLDIFLFLETGALRWGVILIGVWMLSVPIFGRVGCGWFCHMGSWQGFGRFLLRLLPLREPQIVHSRFLKYFIPSLIILSFALPLSLFYAHNAIPIQNIRLDKAQYRPVNDISLMDSFASIATFTLLMIFVFGSRATCRYICPFSMFFRPLSKIAPFKIRKVDDCVECADCSHSCLMGIDVMYEIQTQGKVTNSDCIKCFACLDACDKNSLEIGRASCRERV